ncbi:MAG: class I SAM-dependent RNA methyltransferase, partial [Clostridiales bacterium]|nr:class I SAM-dependent RNA methyltransferase [Clostridiales bacterium]
MKNAVTVSITALGTDGEGIGALPAGKKIFIPGALPGEECIAEITEEKARFARGRLLDITKRSEDRTEDLPIPGANLIHLSYKKQLEYKKDKVRSCLIKIGGMSDREADCILKDTLPSERVLHYRNHTQYKIDGNKICFSEEGTGGPVPIEDSPLEYEVFGKIRDEIDSIFGDAPQRLFSGLVLRGSERTKELLIEFVTDMEGSQETVIRDSRDYIEAVDMENRLKKAAVRYEIKGILLRISPTRTDKRTRSGKRVILTGTDNYREKLCGREFLVKAGAFFQVNTDQAEKLYNEAAKGTENANTIWDLYCGTGSVGLSIVREGQELTGIEISGEA